MIGSERISNDTRLIDLTVGELRALLQDAIPVNNPPESKEYVYGLKGIAECFIALIRKLIVLSAVER